MAEVADVGEQFALALDALRQRALFVRERMPAAGFGEALDQGVGLGIEENQVQVDAALAELQQIIGQFRQRRAAAYVDADGYTLLVLLREELCEPDQQFCRQVV